MHSILQTEKVCFKTGYPFDLHKHHIFGGAKRSTSEKNGFWVWLRSDWHNMSDYGVHFNLEFDLQLKQLCQRKYEETHTRAEFMKLIKRNYLD